MAATVWGAPAVEPELLEHYRPKLVEVVQYTIEGHFHLGDGAPMRPLFETFRKEFMKLYVAYRAETNFVDIVPPQGRLGLSLNMHFHELYDAKGVAKDITYLGRWGNGDVEVGGEQ